MNYKNWILFCGTFFQLQNDQNIVDVGLEENVLQGGDKGPKRAHLDGLDQKHEAGVVADERHLWQ